jgi:hypothetical protein
MKSGILSLAFSSELNNVLVFTALLFVILYEFSSVLVIAFSIDGKELLLPESLTVFCFVLEMFPAGAVDCISAEFSFEFKRTLRALLPDSLCESRIGLPGSLSD